MHNMRHQQSVVLQICERETEMEAEQGPPPPDLTCPVCEKLLKNAVEMPCCRCFLFLVFVVQHNLCCSLHGILGNGVSAVQGGGL